ncbi:MAG: hypothetical protein UR69_C0002G0060 [Candidatus Moranbacteria bacterium GW2011_GWE2_35_2-]|nr:MAG: hypothetical protein UR69_C0002G0060 [Candidatus Moranbacteria bacterium GW2011_GWE2_35_2-]KKQ22591.1 MAG: hypothetical protein US37_C0002G0216 [Candidatus Moranbacteria bacterium GW2011_GWF2_37_11]KKQ28994.1 MAG: hypothetical protein US44_C0004G0038 [Candidatus Moranbacteria bacterium GW2011_GWD1_37_17]KKQ30470.1 MAG: hypothetical protein US47_C0002G0060 [Candidatus Moranbacteria bacterium GW2011_GWE1_37_24]KKQ47794.1 MAG: hypothetical protein US66_C0005G0012 [Candidatus Moranbacteria 
MLLIKTEKEVAMKILIIEDNPIHQEAARKQLSDHDLTIMESFIDFFETFRDCWHDKPSMNLAEFDIVLTDINLPSPHDEEVCVEAATGLVIVLKALQYGVKKIGIITDANHHQDAIGKAFDLWMGSSNGAPFTVGDVMIYPECYNALIVEDEKLIKNWKGLMEGLLSGKHINNQR